ncbi:MAG: hypothetical protein WBC96_12275 [Thermodesulfobacteriota bacterium]
MTKLIYAALLVLFLAPMTFAQDPEAETPKAEVPAAEVQNNSEAPAPETSEAEAPKADAPEAVKPECAEILAQVKEAKAVHDADHKAKGTAFYNWRKYNKELHAMSYEGTDEPLLDSVKKCEEEDKPGKDYCKRVMKVYDKIAPKEKAAKEQLVAADAKSNESRKNYNVLLREAHEKNCLVNQK